MNLIRRNLVLGAAAAPLLSKLGSSAAAAQDKRMRSWKLDTQHRVGIHDVSPAPDGGVWFTGQASGELGWFDPPTGRTELVALGTGSSPHGVIQGPDKAAWITDSGRNAIARVSWPDRQVRSFALPEGTPHANLNTCAFDGAGDLWFTGQSGFVGRVNAKTGEVMVKKAPRGVGPYGICTTPAGEVWWCSLANSFIARVDHKTGEFSVVDTPKPKQGARRVWSDSKGRIWVSHWNTGELSVFDPHARAWRSWKLPGSEPQAYAVYVDERDIVWVSDFGSNAVFSFDPRSEKFERYGFEREGANVRQIHGRRGEVWLPESGTDHISLIRFQA